MRSFRQRDATDCGAVCLAFILHNYKVHASVAAVRARAGTSREGTTLLGLIEAAKSYGFSAKAVKSAIDMVPKLPAPAILHTTTASGAQHFVVLRNATRKRVVIFDPADGEDSKLALDDFGKTWTGVSVLLAPTVTIQRDSQWRGPYRRLYDIIMTQRVVVLQAFVGLVVSTVLSLASAIYIQKIIDGVLNTGNTNMLNLLGSTMLGLIVFRAILGYFQSMLALRTAQRIDSGLILGYYRHLLCLPYSFFDTMRVGEITSRIRDAMKIREFINTNLLNMLLNPLILITSFAAMFYYSWRLAVMSLILVPVYSALYLLSDWLNLGYRRKIMEQNADFDAQVVESLHSINLLRTYRLETPFAQKAEARLVRLFRTLWTSSKAGVVLGTIANLFAQSYTVVLLWIGAAEVLNAHLTPGELMSCNALAGYIVPPIISMIMMNANLRETLVATDRLYEIFDLEIEKNTGTVDLESGAVRKIGFVHVLFHYPGRLPILRAASISFHGGSITALVGESGCGKSSLFSLVVRLYSPQGGNIYINDINVQNFTIASVRKAVCLVPQKTDLFSGTIAENLAPGDEEVDLPRIIELCQRIGLSSFIESLPQQYNTVITEGGTNFSGGQRQRMAIVRALYSRASAYLFDEPTSALDSVSRDQFIAALRELRGAGAVIIVSTHDQSLVRVADRVVQLRDGQLTLRAEAPVEAEIIRN